MKMKTCTKCGVLKSLEDFCRDAGIKDGRKPRCRQCLAELWKKDYENRPEYHKDRVKKWARANPEKRKISQKRMDLKKYGLTLEAYEQMIQDQNGCCKICSQVMDSPNVDHCHITKKVRALLCVHCNSALGSLKDSPDLCVKASEYLKSFL